MYDKNLINSQNVDKTLKIIYKKKNHNCLNKNNI